uniref:PR domain zinc finger protein 2-like n=1 Tax=Astyanax mexicanus TaxID=7994 RepID=W5JXH5_ASTMX
SCRLHETVYNCNKCKLYIQDLPESGMHQQDSGFSCQHCQKQFTTKQGLEQHLHASKSCNTQTFRCRYCRKSFNTQFGRRRHERRHDNSNRRMGTLIVSASSQVEGQTQVMVSSEEGEQRVVASQTITESLVPDFDGKGDSDESGERKAKASLACRYCKKAFGTHTNLRRHERRIHERHLLPRRLCRKVANCQDLPGQQPGEDAEAFTIGSKQREQEEEFMVDISSNISENLSFYIDGKIISTSAVTNCEMMEVNSGAAAAVIGLDALIISPAQITQALKIDTNDYSTTSDLCGQPSGRRRTSTPPLLPQIKTELESESILTTSSSGPTVIGTVLPQPLETIVLQKEKTIYLSPKLKQLLQNQDSSKSFALIGDGQKLCPPLPLTLVSAGTSRFKRRTSSPTSSPQHSRESGIKSTLLIQEQSSPPNKVQKTNSPNTSPAISLCKNYEMENLNIDTTGTTAIPQVLPLDCSTSGTGGRSCNQQPLDLSNAVGKRNSEVLADECVLDLSTGRKSTEADLTGSSASQTTIRRIKPNSSMLEKVLLSQYAATAVDVPPGCAAGDAATLHAPVVADLAVMAVSEPISANPGPERVVFELALPSPSTINASPHPLNAAVLQTTPPSHILSAPSSSTAVPTEILQLEPVDPSNCSVNPTTETTDGSTMDDSVSEEASNLLPLCKHFMCNACDETFPSMKGLSRHIGEHSKTWPYKCEFCVQLFESDTGLLEHRSSYHGIGKIYVCRICSKEFAFLCNLEQHQRDVHPGQECSHTEVENGKLRPENHNNLEKTYKCDQTPKPAVKEEENGNDSDHTTEELYTTIKIMASEGVKPKGTDVRLGINQHYPSFKPPPFPYHNRTPATTTTATATNFTTHNIPQTFSTAIRCTKCGKSFDNMPELHKHILACANASDKKRYTPKKNPIPLKQFAKTQNGVLSPARGVNSRQNVSQKIGHKVKLNMHSKKKSMWVQRSRHHVGRKGLSEELDLYACPHCGKEFTYQASLKKHIVISCPMKPVCNKKSKKRKGSVTPAQENNGSIRTRVAEVIMKQRRSNQGQKIFKKAQISESASADNANLAIKAQDGKRKIIVHNFRPKRSDVLSATSAVHLSKKSKHVLMEGIQSTPQTLQKSSTLQGKSHQQPPTHRVHGGIGREIKQREVNVKLHPRTEEQFSGQRGKERTERLTHCFWITLCCFTPGAWSDSLCSSILLNLVKS